MTRPGPDPLGGDDDPLEQSETLDEDDLGTDPLERGMDPAEDWAAADRYGTTANEQAADRPLNQRLVEERPDTPVDPPRRPVAATPVEDLDESVDEDDPSTVPPADAPESAEGGVLVGEDDDPTGESATRRAGHLVAEPDDPAADETARPRGD